MQTGTIFLQTKIAKPESRAFKTFFLSELVIQLIEDFILRKFSEKQKDD